MKTLVIDFEDMITLATEALRQAGQAAAPSFDHLLLDEAQDTTSRWMPLGDARVRQVEGHPMPLG